LKLKQGQSLPGSYKGTIESALDEVYGPTGWNKFKQGIGSFWKSL